MYNVVNSCELLINCLNIFPLEFLVITKGAEAFIYEWRVVFLSLYMSFSLVYGNMMPSLGKAMLCMMLSSSKW